MKILTRSAVLFLITLTNAKAEQPGLLEPIISSNDNPFVEYLGIPDTLSARTNVKNRFSSSFTLKTSNYSSDNTAGSESIIIDGELNQLHFSFGYGFSDRVDINVTTSLNKHSGGNLDSLIQDWHQVFGLPNGNRANTPERRLLYQYEVAGNRLINHSSGGTHIGDSMVSLGWNFANGGSTHWTIRTGVKLPTGDTKSFTSSGETDAFLALYHSRKLRLLNKTAVWHNSIGGVFIGGNEFLPGAIKSTALFGSTALAWQLFNRVSVKAQLDGHTALYNSALPELGSDTLQLSLGSAIQLGNNWAFEMSFSEDISVEAAPDITFQIGLRRSQR